MGQPVNLNRYRKDKARAEKKARANANAAKYGQSKVDKSVSKLEQDRQRRDLDSHKVEE